MNSVILYDPDLNRAYTFDGVTEISHSLSLKVETEAKATTDAVNGARHEADKVTLTVIMSETMDLPGTTGRIRAHLTDLISLKEARTLCQLHTPYRTYLRMLLTDLSVTQDEKNQFGWTGTLTLQECPLTEDPPRTNNNTSTPQSAGTATSESSVANRALVANRNLLQMHVL